MRCGRTTGIALISVILAVALIATITAGMIARQHVEIRRTTNLIHAYKAYEYALDVEFWGRMVLARDLLEKEKNNTNYSGEAWANPLPPTDIAGGMLAGRIEDLQARFNLNNLQRKHPNDLMRFQELLQQCNLNPDLAWSVVDWIDEDREASAGGAEDYTYLGLETPYRTANAPMANPSELVLVRGFDYDAYTCLLPSISTLPEYVPINVNTAPVPVLMTLVAGMTKIQGEKIVSSREEEPFESVEDFIEFLKEPDVSPLKAKDKFDKDAISVASTYYLIISTARVGNTRLELFSRIKLENGESRVLSRSWGVF